MRKSLARYLAASRIPELKNVTVLAVAWSDLFHEVARIASRHGDEIELAIAMPQNRFVTLSISNCVDANGGDSGFPITAETTIGDIYTFMPSGTSMFVSDSPMSVSALVDSANTRQLAYA